MSIEFLTNEDKTEINKDLAQIETKVKDTEAKLTEKADKTAVSSPYNFKGTATLATLPASGNAINDTYYCTDAKCKYTWNGSEWFQSSLNETEYEEELNALNVKTSDGNLPDASLASRKKTDNICDKYNVNIIPGTINSSLTVINNAVYTLSSIQIPAKATNYYFYTAESIEGLSMGTTKIYANTELPQHGAAVTNTGSVPGQTPHIKGIISVPDTCRYLILSLTFTDLVGTYDEKAAVALARTQKVLESFVVRETDKKKYAEVDYGEMTYEEPYILDVQEENLPPELVEEFKKPKEYGTIKRNISLSVGENLINTTDSNPNDYLWDETIVIYGEGWGGTLVDGLTHELNYEEPIEIHVETKKGSIYFVEWDLEYKDYQSRSSTKVALGNSYAQDTYFGGTHIEMLVRSEGGALFIYPLKSFDGTIKNISCKLVTDSDENIEQELNNILINSGNGELFGRWNVILSDNSLENTVNTTRSVSIGHSSLNSLKGGNRLIAIGTFSMANTETGDRVISIGSDSMLAVKAAEDMVSLGFGAAYYGKNLKRNVVIGAHAMNGAADSEAVENTILGYQAGYYNKKNRNTFIGTYAGYKNIGGYNNVGVGYRALHANIEGNHNTAIGPLARVINEANRSTAIGYDAEATKSDQVVIGGEGVRETLITGNLIVRGTDGVQRQIVFNADGTCSWVAVEE